MYQSKYFVLSGLFALVVGLFAIYWPAFYGPFLLDDQHNLVDTQIDQLNLTSLLTVATGNDSGLLGRPLPVITFALNFYFGDGSPTAFKMTNWVLHVVNSFLVFALCRMLLSQVYASNAQMQKHLTAIALFVAALWAIHPLQISSVMYVVQRMNIMAMMFSLIALVAYTRFRCLQLNGHGNVLLAISVVSIATILSCLCKENGALTPLYILLVEWVFFKFKQNDPRAQRWFRALFGLLTLFAVLVATAGFSIYFDTLMSGYRIRDFSMTERLMTQPLVLMTYLKMILLPSISDMTFYHDNFPTVRVLDQRTVIACLALGVSLVVSILSVRKAPLVAFGVLFFLTSQLMESTVFPLEMVFEHRNYIGLLGLILAFASICSWAVQKIQSSALALVLGFSTLAFMGFSAHVRAIEWSSDIQLHAFAVENQPMSSRARTAFIGILSNEGRNQEALQQFEVLHALKPKDPYVALFGLRLAQKTNIHIEGLVYKAIKLLKDGTINTDVIQKLLELSTRRNDPNNPSFELKYHIALFESAVENPDKLINVKAEGFLYGQLGEMLLEAGRVSDAVMVHHNAVRIFSGNTRIALRHIDMLIEDGQFVLAKEQLELLRSRIHQKNTQAISRIAELDARLVNETSSSVDTSEL